MFTPLFSSDPLLSISPASPSSSFFTAQSSASVRSKAFRLPQHPELLLSLASPCLWCLWISYPTVFLVSPLQLSFTQCCSSRKIQAGRVSWSHLEKSQDLTVLAGVITLFLVLPWSEGFWLTKELTECGSGFIGPGSVLGAGPALAICSPVKRAMAWVKISQAMNLDQVLQGKHRLGDTGELLHFGVITAPSNVTLQSSTFQKLPENLIPLKASDC